MNFECRFKNLLTEQDSGDRGIMHKESVVTALADDDDDDNIMSPYKLQPLLALNQQDSDQKKNAMISKITIKSQKALMAKARQVIRPPSVQVVYSQK